MKYLAHGEMGRERLALLDGQRVLDLEPLTGDARALTGTFLASDGPRAVEAALADGRLREIPRDRVGRIGAPLAPGKIVCVGLNYRDHAAETGAELPEEPIVFLKAPDTVIGPHDDVLLPRGSTRTDWEVELGVVIGSTLRYAADEAEAMGAVAGYVLSHDVSERDFQLERGGTWDKGKNCETFNPLGPWFVTADEIPDVQDLRLQLTVNGTLRQDGTTAEQIFPVAEVLRYLSHFMTLRPGDLVNTGTPAGVALGRPDVPYLRAGDVVELSITHLGSQRQCLRSA